jgi:hypothetical protein
MSKAAIDAKAVNVDVVVEVIVDGDADVVAAATIGVPRR